MSRPKVPQSARTKPGPTKHYTTPGMAALRRGRRKLEVRRPAALGAGAARGRTSNVPHASRFSIANGNSAANFPLAMENPLDSLPYFCYIHSDCIL